VFQESEDHAGLAKSWRLLAWTHGTACNFGLAAEAQEHALQEARLAGDVRQQSRAATAYAVAAVFGPTRVSEAIERCEEMLELVSGDRHSEGILLGYLASLLAMQGEFDRARELISHGRALLQELGLEVESALMEHPAVAQAGVIGKPDPVRTEIVKAFIVLKPGDAPSDALAAEIQSFVRTRLSAHEYPREIAFIEEMPMTTTGKVIRRLLRQRA